ncbi:MAG: glycosyltransferase family 1 protein [Cyclobacteriaceae bacterium]
MRILVDAHVLDETHQGTRTYIKGLYSELVRLMPNATFFFVSYNLDNLKSEIGQHSNVQFLPIKRGKLLRLLFEIPFIIWKNKIDFAHFQYVSPPIKNCKHIVTIHDVLFKDYKKFFPLKYRVMNDVLFRISAIRADILFTVSHYSQQRISVHYKISEERIGITPNGISHEFLASDESDVSKKINSRYDLDKFILYVSRIEPRKNHLILLRAFLDLKLWESNYKLVFIGKKDFLYEDIDFFIKNCPNECRNSILLLQNIDSRELLLFYKSASLFVYPSLAEGFGIPPIEAISVGTPTLCSNTTAMKDFYFLEEDLFNPNDLEEVKTKIKGKLMHPVNPTRIDLLKKVVKEKYSWSESAKVFASFVEKYTISSES